jgi:putative nucleotidyltransferase with HDIG domain
VAQHYVIPSTGEDGITTMSLVGGLLGIGVLSLASFFALRRLVQGAVAKIDADNLRLTSLLSASRGFTNAPHGHAVASAACEFACEITGCSDAVILMTSSKTQELELYDAALDQSRVLYEAHREELEELAETASRSLSCSRLKARPDRKASVPLADALAVPIISNSGSSGALVLASGDDETSLEPECVDAVTTLASLTTVALEISQLQDSQRNFFAHTTDLMAGAVDQHVENRQGHSLNVARLVNRIGREMGMQEAKLQTLHYAALLHDIGMLKIEPSLHRNAKACRKHTQLGHRMLSRIQLWEEVAPIVLHHHEWFDGSGYPDGISGQDIPLMSRIIAVADAVDAMRRPEGTRPGRSLAEVVEELARCSSTQFDPAIVRVFQTLAERGDIQL